MYTGAASQAALQLGRLQLLTLQVQSLHSLNSHQHVTEAGTRLGPGVP